MVDLQREAVNAVECKAKNTHIHALVAVQKQILQLWLECLSKHRACKSILQVWCMPHANGLTLTVLSQPAVAKRAMGCAGGFPDTKDPGGAAGDQDTAVQPTLCASTCTYICCWMLLLCLCSCLCLSSVTCEAQCMNVADVKCVCSDLTSRNIQ